ncbi:MAG: hypothetical protein KA712_02215 [Myxococcales bacterium]|nr:hypothetical protein [Myxococcales bacterium]
MVIRVRPVDGFTAFSGLLALLVFVGCTVEAEGIGSADPDPNLLDAGAQPLLDTGIVPGAGGSVGMVSPDASVVGEPETGSDGSGGAGGQPLGGGGMGGVVGAGGSGDIPASGGTGGTPDPGTQGGSPGGGGMGPVGQGGQTGLGGQGGEGGGQIPPGKGPNLVDNAGFEKGLLDWKNVRGTGGLFEPGYESMTGLLEPSLLGWWQQDLGRFVPGRAYVISGWGRAPQGGCRIGIKGGASAGEIRRDSEPFGPTWSERSFVFTLPTDLRWLQIFLANTTGTNCEYDDLSVRRGDANE